MSQDGELSQSEVEWLSLLRYQLSVAREQARMPPPLSALTINTLQDCVEGLLSLAAEHLKADVKKRSDFGQLFDSVMTALDDPGPVVGFRQAMNAMNSARVGFKHQGNAPADTTIRRHLDRSAEFMESLARAAFSRSLDSVGLLLFVRHDEVRQHLEASRTKWPGDTQGAMISLKLAFDLLVKDFEVRKRWHPGKTLFSTKPPFAPKQSDFRGIGKGYDKKLGKVIEWLEDIDAWVKNLALGIDMRRFAFFNAHTPHVVYTLTGTPHVNLRQDIVLTDEIFERCFTFVVDTALEFAAADFDFDAWSARNRREDADT